MVFILDNQAVQLQKIKTRGGDWTPSCQWCRHKFQDGFYRYQWRFMTPNGYPMCSWTTTCMKCLITAVKDMSATSEHIVKALSQ